MIQEEILKQAIEQAQRNGYQLPSWYIGLVKNTGHYQRENDIIFDHEFARCFFRDKKLGQLDWKSHLEELVLQEDRLEYIKGFIE